MNFGLLKLISGGYLYHNLERNRMEYTKELLSSNCDIKFINHIYYSVGIITQNVFKNIDGKEGNGFYKNKIVFDYTSEKEYRHIKPDEEYEYNVEQSWFHALESVVKQLKCRFVDIDVHYEIKNVMQKEGVKKTYAVIVDWN